MKEHWPLLTFQKGLYLVANQIFEIFICTRNMEFAAAFLFSSLPKLISSILIVSKKSYCVWLEIKVSLFSKSSHCVNLEFYQCIKNSNRRLITIRLSCQVRSCKQEPMPRFFKILRPWIQVSPHVPDPVPQKNLTTHKEESLSTVLLIEFFS